MRTHSRSSGYCLELLSSANTHSLEWFVIWAYQILTSNGTEHKYDSRIPFSLVSDFPNQLLPHEPPDNRMTELLKYIFSSVLVSQYLNTKTEGFSLTANGP